MLTYWQQSVLKICLKIIGVIILLIVIALFLYYHFYFKKDNLIKYVPADSVVYATFRLDKKIADNNLINNNLINWQQEYNFPEIDFNLLNPFVNYNAAIAIIPRKDTLNFDYLLIFDLKPLDADIKDFIDYFTVYGWQYDLFKMQAIGKNILIVSNSTQVIDQTRKIINQQQESLINNINVVVNLKNLKNDYTAKIFINSKSLLNNLKQIDDLKFKILTASLQNYNLDQLFLGLDSQNNRLLLETNNQNSDYFENLDLMAKLPLDFKYSLSFTNGAAKWLNLTDILKEVDYQSWLSLQDNKQYLEKIYDFNFNADILANFNTNCQFTTDKANNFILALNLAKFNDFEDKIIHIEDLIKQYIAYNKPREKEKMLPDNTYITEIIKDIKSVNISQEELANISIKIFNKDNLEIAYFIQDNQLFLSNSSQKLRNLINEQEIINISTLSCYNKANFSQNLIFNGNQLFNDGSQFQLFQYLFINDNLTKNQQIRICME